MNNLEATDVLDQVAQDTLENYKVLSSEELPVDMDQDQDFERMDVLSFDEDRYQVLVYKFDDENSYAVDDIDQQVCERGGEPIEETYQIEELSKGVRQKLDELRH